jgi:hypothetical protein
MATFRGEASGRECDEMGSRMVKLKMTHDDQGAKDF